MRRDHGEKVGHAGTLDPFATGLLILLLGRSTRLQRFFMALPKTYRAVARLGWRSTTGDPDGELTETGRIPERLELPTGTLRQRVPMTSAVKVGGERLYRRAHRGEEIETPEREVTIHRAELLEISGGRVTFEIECSAGTYVRTLVETLEDAYCEELRRTEIGPFSVEDAGGEPIPPEVALGFLPPVELDANQAQGVRHGRPVDATPEREGPVRLVHGNELLAVGEPREGKIRPVVVLA